MFTSTILEHSDSEIRESIGNNLRALAKCSDDAGITMGKAHSSGRHALKEIIYRYTRLRELLQEVREETISPQRFLEWRRNTLKSVEWDLKRWQDEVQLGKKQVAEAFGIADHIGPEILKHRWLEGVSSATTLSTAYAFLRKALDVVHIIRDESDIWWKPFFSNPIPERQKASLIKNTKAMRESMTALRAVKFEMDALQFIVGKLYDEVEGAARRNWEIERCSSADISLSQFNRSLEKLGSAGF